MNLMKKAAFLMVLLFAVSCSSEAPDEGEKQIGRNLIKFTSDAYGFSFGYPNGWISVEKDLPDRWAAMDKNSNTLLFIVSRSGNDNLMSLGREQAATDLYPESSEISEDQDTNIKEIVKVQSFNERNWYTYGLKFQENGVDSLVSGTLCGDKHVLMVLVSSTELFESNKQIYADMLNSFSCGAAE